MRPKSGSWISAIKLLFPLVGLGMMLAADRAAADQVIADDLIVQGSLCVGLDCVNNESFGFDTIRLKENNTRIKFDDTSASTGFPANDWQLTANDSASGGSNKFSIEDVTGSKVPFTVTAGAATNSIFVDSTGRVGFRTNTPVLDLHVATSNTPAMRLEQNSTGGFTAQTWDVAGNEANFFVRDVTGGSRLPFRIRPGAPTSSIDISSSGNVGIGTASPSAQLHVVKPAASSTGEVITQYSVSDDALGKLVLKNGSATDGIFHPRFQGTTASQAVPLTMEGVITDDLGTNPIVAFDAARAAGGAIATRPLVAFRNNTVVKASVAANGDMFATSFNPTSTRTAKDNIVDLDSRKASEALQQLTPVEYVYKDDATGEKRVGFIAEDVPDLVANADRKTVPIMDVVALVAKVVKDQQQTIDDQKKTIEELTKRLSALEGQMNEKK